VHRDVKPANLLLEPGPPHLRLGDFGVAVPLEDVRLTRAPGAVGTDGYMAPEQAAGAPPDPRQDLYAAGVVATQLLTGRLGAPVPDGPLRPVLEALRATHPELRPTAEQALASLRRLHLPPDGPWPVVPDRLGDPLRERTATWELLAIACFVAAIALSAVAIYLALS
jgi:serine/threonine protein kinase